MSAMEALNKISQDAKNEVDDDDSAAEYDEDFLSDYMEYTVGRLKCFCFFVMGTY